MDFREVTKVKGDTLGQTIENISILTIIVSGILITVGIGIGSYVSGIPVVMAMVGSFLVFIGLIVFVAGEFIQMYEERESNGKNAQ